MEAVKLVAVFLAVVLVQVVGALSSPLSKEGQEEGVWTLDPWQVLSLKPPTYIYTKYF